MIEQFKSQCQYLSLLLSLVKFVGLVEAILCLGQEC
jgi:hypothetical protein